MQAAEIRTKFLGKLSASLVDGTFVRLVLSLPAQAGDAPQRVTARCIDLRGTPHLSITSSHATRDETRNLPLLQAVDWIRQQLDSVCRSALLCTTNRDWQFTHPSFGVARLIGHKPGTVEPPARTHDRPHQSWLDASANGWLQALEIVDPQGRVFPRMADKHRQIHHYLELLGHLAEDCGWRAGQPVTVADMGCGKGYLTFGAWHLFRQRLKMDARVLGVEVLDELVTMANAAARKIGAEGLKFVPGSVGSVALPAVDALIALHACDTATDDAIRRGIEAGATLIVVAPCCHKEARPQIQSPGPLAPVMQHGIMAGRMAEWVTDGLRALFLEWAGYRPKLLEFVASEHTPKNLMIAAVRQGRAFTSEESKRRIHALKSCFGIQHHALDPLLTCPPGEGSGRI